MTMYINRRRRRLSIFVASAMILALAAASCASAETDDTAMTAIDDLRTELTALSADLEVATSDSELIALRAELDALSADLDEAARNTDVAQKAANAAQQAAAGNLANLQQAQADLQQAQADLQQAQDAAEAASKKADEARARAEVARLEAEEARAQADAARTVLRAVTGEVTLEFWSWNNEGAYPEVHEDAEKRFEAEYPNVDVKRTYTPFADYMTKLRTSMAAGEPPDIAQVPWTGEYTDLVSNGQLASLASEFDVRFPDFFDPIASIANVEGIPYAIPLDVNSLQIAYNKDIFDELGLDVPRSKDELIAVVNALSAADYFGVAVGTSDRWAGGDLFFNQLAYTDPTNSLIVQADAGSAPWDSSEFQQAAENLAELIDAGVFAPGSNSMVSFVEALDLFVFEQAAMFFPVGNFITGGIADKVQDSFEWGLFPFPSPTGGESYAVGGVAEMFSVPSDAANDELAVEFLRFLTDAEGEAALVSNNFIPSWNIQLPSDVSDLYRDLIAAQATVRNRTVYTTPVYNEILNGVQGLLDQSTTPEEMIAKMVEAAP